MLLSLQHLCRERHLAKTAHLEQECCSPAQGRTYDSPKDVPRCYPNGGELHKIAAPCQARQSSTTACFLSDQSFGAVQAREG